MIDATPFARTFVLGRVRQPVVIEGPKPEDFLSFSENEYLDELCEIIDRTSEAAFGVFSNLVDKISSWVG